MQRPRPTLIFLLAAAILSGSWFVLHWGSAASQPLLSGLLEVPVFLAAAACCLGTSRRVQGNERRSWLAIALGVLAFGLGQTVYTLIGSVLHSTPFPSVADVFFLSMPVCVGVGLLYWPQVRLSPWGLARLLLDTGIMTSVALVFSWRFVLSGLARAYVQQPLAGTIALAYPVLDLALLCLLLAKLLRRNALPVAVNVLVVAALGAFIVADTGFALHNAAGTYVSGGLDDVYWTLGAVLFGLAACTRPLTSAPVASTAQAPMPSRWLAAGPYLSVAACMGLLIETFDVGETTAIDRGVLWGNALVVALVMIRLAESALENGHLNRGLQTQVNRQTADLRDAYGQLQSFAAELEDKVTARTAELEASRAQLAHQAHHDALSGLPNRLLFEDRLDQAVSASLGHGRALALLYLDLDGFKLINDTLGHAAGDEVIRMVGRRLLPLVRAGDTVARIGGDEFAVVLENGGDAGAVAVIANRICEAVRQDYHLGGASASVTVSIGIALCPADAADALTLRLQADAAMYQAKHAGKNRICFAEQRASAAVQERADLAVQLREAVARQEFRIVYQPQFDALSGQLASFEALLRWQTSSGESIPPDTFIPIAEQTGQIVEIGTWVLNEVCRHHRRWRLAGLVGVPVAVNVSPSQFAREGFVAGVRQALNRHGVDAHCLELELTEEVLIRDVPAVARKIADLRRVGLKVSIDDFGAGYSGLSSLLRLPVHAVKIDRSLIRGLGNTTGLAPTRVVQAIVALAHALGLQVVAEGVETDEQAHEARALGCQRLQGYRMGHPEPEASARLRLRALSPQPSGA